MKTKYLTKSQEFDGLPKVEDFKCVEEDIDDSIGDGGNNSLFCNLLL